MQLLVNLSAYPLTEALEVTAMTTTTTTVDLLNRKSCIKLPTVTTPPHLPRDPTRPSTLHCAASTSDTRSYFRPTDSEREKRIPAESCQRLQKNIFPLKKKERKKKTEAGKPRPTRCNPRSLAKRDRCVGWQILSEEMRPDFHTQQRRAG